MKIHLLPATVLSLTAAGVRIFVLSLATFATLAGLKAQSEDPNPYTFTTLAGVAADDSARYLDAVGSAARIAYPHGVAAASDGNVYVVATSAHSIRKISAAGEVTTFAGSPDTTGWANGTGTGAFFDSPEGLAVDGSGNVYVADSGNHTIRKITPGGVVTTFAGLAGSAGSIDGTGSAARFTAPSAIACDAVGNVYVADAAVTIRKITSAGEVTTLAGSAGNFGFSNGTGSNAQFSGILGIAVDRSGNVFVVESSDHTVRRVTPAGEVTTFAGTQGGNIGATDGTGSDAQFWTPSGLAADSLGNVYVADLDNNTIRKISPGAVVTTLAGTAGERGAADGLGSAARFNSPTGVTADLAGNLYVADTTNNTIRKISSVGAVSTLAGIAGGVGSADGANRAAQFFSPAGIAVDSANTVYVASTGNHTIRKISAAGVVTTLAGAPGVMGYLDGTGSAAQFNRPDGLAVDASGNVYVADTANHTIRKITFSGVVTTLAGLAGGPGSTDGSGTAARFNEPTGVAVDSSGNLYVADSANFTIRKITAAGVVTTLAGFPAVSGAADGLGSAARFFYPSDVATDSVGNIYVADSGNHAIRKISAVGEVTTIATLFSRLSQPSGVAVDGAGNIYFSLADFTETINKIAPDGTVTAIAGRNSWRGWTDGTGTAALFNNPSGIAMDSAGRIYVADTANHTIRVGAALQNPMITIQPMSQVVSAYDSVTFSAVAVGTPAPTLQWKRGGVAIAGATGATLSIASALTSDAGSYTVVATNEFGSATSNSAILTVNKAAASVALLGLSATYDGSPHVVTATTSPASLAVDITYNGSATAPTDTGTYAVVGTINNANFSGSTAGSLVVAKATPVINWATPGGIVYGAPLSSMQLNATSNVAGTFSYTPPNGTILNVGSSALNVSFVPNDALNYTNSSAQRTIIVSVSAISPAFTTQPLSQAAFVGSLVNISTVASGAPAPTYQWQKGGINLSIPSSTSSLLTIPNVQLSDAGSYAVVATNVAGSIISRFARLVVLVPQQNAITYATTRASTGVTAGGIVNFDYFVTNVGTKTWGAKHYLSIRDVNNTFVAFSSLIGILPGETTTANLNFPAPTTPGTYTYYVQGLEDGVEFFSTQTTVVLTVLAALPNAITYNTTTFPVSAAPGSNVIFTYNVTNTGTATWGANHILSLKNASGTVISSTPLTVLAPGASKTVNLSFTVPSTPGSYNYSVQASQTGVGNFGTQANLTLIALAAQPNAIVYNRVRYPDEVVPGAVLSLKYTLSNAGTQAWGAGHYVSLRDSASNYLAFIPLNGTAAGATKTVEFTLTAPTTPGTYTYYVQALEDGVEFFSTQDVVVITVVALPLGNAVSYNTSTIPVTAPPGATVNFTANVTNSGTRTWGATHYLSFRDVDNTFLAFPTLNGVAPGASRTSNFSFTAPTTPGVYTYTLQAFEDGVSFFEMADTVVLLVQ